MFCCRQLEEVEVVVEGCGSSGVEAPRLCIVVKYQSADTMGRRDKEPSDNVLLKNNDA